MQLYLQTANPQHFFEMNQYLPLKGVLFDAVEAVKKKLDPNDVLPQFLEYLSSDQQLLVPVISGGFRNQLEEIKTLHRLYPQLVFRLFSRPDGLMCQKACKTLHLPCILEGIDSPGQLLLAISTGQPVLVSLSGNDSFVFEQPQLLKSVQSLSQQEKERILCSDIRQNQDLIEALHAGISSFALRYEILNELLYPAVSGAVQQDMKENWLIQFSLTTFADLQPKSDEATD